MRLAITIVVLCACSSAAAQSRLDRAYVAETIVGSDDHAGITEVGLGTPPLRLARLGEGRDLMLFFGVYARRTWLAGADPRDGGTLTVNDGQLSFTLVAPISERWTLSLIPVVAARGSFDADFHVPHDLSVNALALAGYAIGGNRDFVFSFGLLFLNTLPFTPVIPIAGVRYTSERWRVEATWPQPQAVYRLGDRVELGLALRFDYPLYRIVPVDFATGDRAEFARLVNHYASVIASVRLTEELWFTAKPGIAFGRVVHLTDHDRDNLDDGKQSLATAPMVTFVLSWRGRRR